MKDLLAKMKRLLSLWRKHSDPFFWMQGNIMYTLRSYLPAFIKEQVEWRQHRMNPACHQGTCVHCGCSTPELQYATRGCRAGCYPPMAWPWDWPWFKQFMAFKTVASNPMMQVHNWTGATDIDLGDVEEGKTYRMEFEYIGKYKVKDTKRRADVKQVQTALAVYNQKFNQFPEVGDDDFRGWDTTYEPLGQPYEFLNILQENKIIDRVPRDPVNSDIYFYRYKKFPSGSFGCNRGFYILQVMNFEGQTEDHGWGSCPGRNFVDEAPNGYTIQVFD